MEFKLSFPRKPLLIISNYFLTPKLLCHWMPNRIKTKVNNSSNKMTKTSLKFLAISTKKEPVNGSPLTL